MCTVKKVCGFLTISQRRQYRRLNFLCKIIRRKWWQMWGLGEPIPKLLWKWQTHAINDVQEKQNYFDRRKAIHSVALQWHVRNQTRFQCYPWQSLTNQKKRKRKEKSTKKCMCSTWDCLRNIDRDNKFMAQASLRFASCIQPKCSFESECTECWRTARPAHLGTLYARNARADH